jgi:hypothetical protein
MANKGFAHLNNFPQISPPEASPQDITTSFSEILLSEELPIDYMSGNTNNTASEIVSDAGTAGHPTEEPVVFSTANSNIDDKFVDIDLTTIKDIPEITQSGKNPQVKTISTSQPAFHGSGTYNMASASASVRAVNSPNIVNKSFTVSAGVKPTQTTDSQDVKILDDLPAIKLTEIPKLTPKINRISKIQKNTVSETQPVNELALDYMLGDKYKAISQKDDSINLDTGKNSRTSRTVTHAAIDSSTNEVISSINIDSKNHRLSEENIDDLNKANSNIVSQASNDVLILETDFAPSISHSDDGSSDYSIEVNLKNGIVDSTSDNLFYLGTNEHILGGEPDDKFFVESGGGNILFGGGTDQF